MGGMGLVNYFFKSWMIIGLSAIIEWLFGVRIAIFPRCRVPGDSSLGFVGSFLVTKTRFFHV
jgi:hypothetical protein